MFCNLSDLSKMLETNEISLSPIGTWMESSDFTRTINTINNLYLDGLDDYKITEMINVLCTE